MQGQSQGRAREAGRDVDQLGADGARRGFGVEGRRESAGGAGKIVGHRGADQPGAAGPELSGRYLESIPTCPTCPSPDGSPLSIARHWPECTSVTSPAGWRPFPLGSNCPSQRRSTDDQAWGASSRSTGLAVTSAKSLSSRSAAPDPYDAAAMRLLVSAAARHQADAREPPIFCVTRALRDLAVARPGVRTAGALVEVGDRLPRLRGVTWQLTPEPHVGIGTLCDFAAAAETFHSHAVIHLRSGQPVTSLPSG
jgi:hypothetical protein